MSRIVELRWDCKECSTAGILGRHKRCPQCGSPRESGEMKMDGLDTPGATVTDASLLDLAHAGADWFCADCMSGNKGDAEQCGSCGAPRAPQEPAITAAQVNQLAEDLGEVAEDAAKVAFGLAFAGTGAMMLIAGMAVAFLMTVLCALSLIAAVPDRPPTPEPQIIVVEYDVTATVSEMTWRHETVRQTYTQYKRSAFHSDIRAVAPVMPVEGRGERGGSVLVAESCRPKHHHDEQYQCGSHQVCEDVYKTVQESYSCTSTEDYDCGEDCRDLGNGFAECSPKTCTRTVSDTCYRSAQAFSHKDCRDEPDYCTRGIDADYCDYTTWDWAVTDTKVLAGTGTEVRWEQLQPGPRDRILKNSDYVVTLVWGAGERARDVRIPPRSQADFQSWSSSEEVQLTIESPGEFPARVTRGDGEVIGLR